MKAIYCLLALSFFAGWASSEFAWKTGKSYKYAVRGRLMNGVAELNTQYAGLEVDYKVILTVTGSNTVNWKATDFKVYEVNDVIKKGWRDGELVNETPVEIKPEFREYLESPMEITFEQGVVKSIKVDGRLPNWALNMKKAQASHFVLDTTGVNAVLIGNLNRKTDHVRPEERNMESGFFYETMEKTVHGECSTYYTVSQNAPFRRPFPFQRQGQPGIVSEESSEETFESTETETHDHEYEHEHIHEHDSEHEIIKEHPWHKTFNQFCHENDQVYEIIKSVNFTACKNKPVHAFNAPSSLVDARAGDNGLGTLGTRSLVSRILACGKDRKQFTILKIRQEEVFKFGLHITKKIVGGAIKNLTLIEVTDKQTPVQIKNPKVITNILYKFVLQKHGHHHDEEMMQMDAAYLNQHESSEEIRTVPTMEEEIDEDARLPKPTLKEAPVLPMLITPLNIDGMKKRITTLMHEVIQDMVKPAGKEGIAEKETLGKISTISKILRHMSYTDVEELYHKLATKHETLEDQTYRSMYLDCVAIAGTNPNIKFLIDLIQKKEIVGERASQVLMSLPMYIRTPTKELLNEYFNLLKSDVLRSEHKQVRTTAVLSFSTILYEACMHTKIRNSRYPIALYGKFCDAQLVEQEYLPWFVQHLETVIKSNDKEDRHWRIVFLNALGNIGHPAFIPVAQRLMDNRHNPLLKSKVIFALKHMIVARASHNVPERRIPVVDREIRDVISDEIVEKKVLPILMSAAFDKGEHPEVRMSAITLLFYTTNADRAIWQQLAYLTWFEVSQEVHSLIYNTLKSMTDIKHPMHRIHRNMQLKARQVLSLCKPITAGWTKSRSIVVADWIPEFLSGYFHQFAYFGSKDSLIPNMMYYRNFYQLGENGLGVNPIEISFHGHTVQKLMNHFVEQFMPISTADHEAHEDIARIHQILGIETRKQTEPVEGYLMIKIRNEIERMFSLNKETIEKYAKQLIDEILPKLKNGLPINYQKTFRFSELSAEVPTLFGLPLNYKFRMPVHFSLRGNVKLVAEDNLKDVQLQAELHPVYAWKAHDKLSFKVPFLNKKYQTGFQNHVVVEFPFRALIRRAPRGQFMVAITPTHITEGRTPNEELNLITYHQKPYTTIITDDCWPTNHKEGGEVKIVHAQETPYVSDRRFGEKHIGFSFRVEEHTEFKIQKETTSGWMHFWTRFHSPAGWFNLGWLGSPSVRLSKRKLTLDMSQSETKTLAFVFGGNFALYRNHDQAREENEEKRVYAFAVIGKKNPIHPVKTSQGVQKILTKGTPSTVNYVWELISTRGKLNLRVAAGDAAKEAVEKLPQDIPSLAAIREYITECPITKTQRDFCVELKGEIQRPNWANRRELIVLRKQLLSRDLSVKVNTELHFGKKCSELNHQIKMEGNLRRGSKMTEWARTKSPHALKCNEDEKKGFSVSPVCLWVSEQQAAALNKGKLEFTFTDLPAVFKNYTYKVEDFAKAMLYPYVSHDRFPESPLGEKKLVLNFEMTPDREFLTVHIDKPTARLSFRDVKTTWWVKKFLPLTATQSVFENVRDRTLRVYSEPSCTLEGRFVNTFDNVTYSFGKNIATGCTHVLTKDCSGKYPMAVLVKNIHTEQKKVTVLLGAKTKITITPAGSSMIPWRRGNMKVEVNNQVVETFPKVIHGHDSERVIAKIEVMVNGGIQVITPRIRLATDGARVVVYGHNDYRNRTCGLCGYFDGEKNSEMRSPKNCPLSSGSLLVASYAFPALHAEGNTECKVRPEIKKRIEQEDRDCMAQRTMTTTETHYTMTDSSEESHEHEVVEDECNIIKKLAKHFPGVGICTSEKPIHRCAPGCHAEDTVEKTVMFRCEKRGRTIRDFMKRIHIDVPTNCVQN